MIFNINLAILSFVAIVAAQSSSGSAASGTASASASGASSGNASPPMATPDACILGCVGPAATAAGCSSFTDLGCVCTSQQFQQAAMSCLTANCTSSDVTAALALQSSECAAVMSSGSVTAPAPSGPPSAPAATSGALTGNTPTTPTSPAAAGTSAATAASPPASPGAASPTGVSIWGMVAGIVGAAAAAAL